MNSPRPKSIPLPCALLALSVAIALGAAGPVEASTLRSASATQADQRETIEHLIGAIQQAAKKLSDQLNGQSALFERGGVHPSVAIVIRSTTSVSDETLAVPFLREALLNIPPPVC